MKTWVSLVQKQKEEEVSVAPVDVTDKRGHCTKDWHMSDSIHISVLYIILHGVSTLKQVDTAQRSNMEFHKD